MDDLLREVILISKVFVRETAQQIPKMTLRKTFTPTFYNLCYQKK